MIGSDVYNRLANVSLPRLLAGIAMISFLSSCISIESLTIRGATLASGGICDSSYSGVQNANCLWVAAGESVGLQWNINACVETENGPITNITKLSGETHYCPIRPMAPTRGPACAIDTCYGGTYRADNENIISHPTDSVGIFLKCTAPVDDECHTMTRSCQRVERPCAGISTSYNYPFCSLGCKQQIDQDQTLLVDTSSSISFPPILISPRKFFAVSNTRRVVRTATFSPMESDLMAGPLVWNYHVPQVEGVLEENFSPNLFISRIRVFTSPNPTSFARDYLNVLRVQIDSGSIIDLGLGINCPGSDADATVVTSDNCPPLGVATPSYIGSASSQSAPPLVWKIKLLDGAHGGNASLTSTTPVFIEFTLASRTASGGSIFLRTAAWDYHYNFGVLPAGAQRTDLGALKIDLGDSAVRWMVESISLSGSNAQDFTLQLDGPDTIGAGGVRNVNVTFRPSSEGSKVATGVIKFVDPTGNHQSVSASLQAQSGAHSLGVVPNTLNFFVNTSPSQPLPSRKNVLLENYGYSSVVVQNVMIIGTDADSFSLSRGLNSESPVSPAFAIASGGSELLHVFFCPARYGTFSAQVAITEDEGTTATPIVAVRTVSLQGSVYAPTPLCLTLTNIPFAPGRP